MHSKESTQFNISQGLINVLKGNFFDLIFEKFVEQRYPFIVTKKSGIPTNPWKVRIAYAFFYKPLKEDLVRRFVQLKSMKHGVPLFDSEKEELIKLEKDIQKKQFDDISNCFKLEEEYHKSVGIWQADFTVFTPEHIDIYEFKSGKNINFKNTQRTNLKKLKNSGLPIKIFVINANYDFPETYEINVFDFHF